MDKQFDDLLAKHLNGAIREDEKKLLAILLERPDNQLYLASKIDESFFDAAVPADVDSEMGNQLFQQIKQHIYKQNLPQENKEEGYPAIEPVTNTWYVKRVLKWGAVAASLILMVVVGVVVNNKKTEQPSIVIQSDQPTETIQPHLQHELNTTGKEKMFRLADGSFVILANNSEISYQVPFSKRDITLTGKAYFKVAKDKTRPFTVFSGAVSTTALGTEFMVTAYEKTTQLKVRLYEGKVVVKAIDRKNKRMKGDVYLTPGQEFIYNELSIAKVSRFEQKQNATAIQNMMDEQSNDQPSIPEDQSGNWYMFNNQSLEKVLDDLAGMYNKKIVYNKKDVQLIYFTGKYQKSDSLETILKRIATLNDLHIVKSDTAYIITK